MKILGSNDDSGAGWARSFTGLVVKQVAPQVERPAFLFASECWRWVSVLKSQGPAINQCGGRSQTALVANTEVPAPSGCKEDMPTASVCTMTYQCRQLFTDSLHIQHLSIAAL